MSQAADLTRMVSWTVTAPPSLESVKEVFFVGVGRV